jgi:hypothetical protein
LPIPNLPERGCIVVDHVDPTGASGLVKNLVGESLVPILDEREQQQSHTY